MLNKIKESIKENFFVGLNVLSLMFFIFVPIFILFYICDSFSAKHQHYFYLNSNPSVKIGEFSSHQKCVYGVVYTSYDMKKLVSQNGLPLSCTSTK